MDTTEHDIILLLSLCYFLVYTQLSKQFYITMKQDKLQIPIYPLLVHHITQDETTGQLKCSPSLFSKSLLQRRNRLFACALEQAYLCSSTSWYYSIKEHFDRKHVELTGFQAFHLMFVFFYDNSYRCSIFNDKFRYAHHSVTRIYCCVNKNAQ